MQEHGFKIIYDDEGNFFDIEACEVRNGLFVCGDRPFQWGKGEAYARLTIRTDADPRDINVLVRKALLGANRAAAVPKLVIKDGLLSIVGYRNVARVKRRGKDVDGAEVCIPEVLLADAAVLAGLLPEAAELVHENQASNIVPSAVPVTALKAMLASGDLPAFPVVNSVGSVPVVGLDGSILTKPGYHASPNYHLLTDDMETAWLDVPDNPTDEQVHRALDTYGVLLDGFPFDDDASKANTLAYLLTPPLRHHFSIVPVFGFDAAQSQTGKTLLATTGQVIWDGAATTTTFPESREEMRKVLFAQALGGQRSIVWDNLDAAVNSGPFAAMITSPNVRDRVLGVSKTASLANVAIHAMTGNKMQVSKEIANRLVRIRLDAHMPNPESRGGFTVQLPEWTFANRAQLVWAAHIMIRRWWSDGRPEGSIGQLGDGSAFIDWARILGGVLSNVEQIVGEHWLGNFMGTYATGQEEFVTDDEVSESAVVARVLNGMKGWNSAAQVIEVGALDEEFPGLFKGRGGMNRQAAGLLLKRVSGHTFEFRGKQVRILRRGGETPTYRLGREREADSV